jgi:hypothetical protein
MNESKLLVARARLELIFESGDIRMVELIAGMLDLVVRAVTRGSSSEPQRKGD